MAVVSLPAGAAQGSAETQVTRVHLAWESFLQLDTDTVSCA